MTESEREKGGTTWDAPNQQVVRPDQSAPWDEGEGGTKQAEPEDQLQETPADQPQETPADQPQKRGPGRPRKTPAPEPTPEPAEAESET